MLVEAARTQDQARRFPLAPGDAIWVGVRRIHALAHPGLRLLLLTDGSAAAQMALDLGGQIARLAHARTAIIGYGMPADALQRHLQTAKEQIGSGLPALDTRAAPDPPSESLAREIERQPYDLVVMHSQPQKNVDLAEAILQAGEHHLAVRQAGLRGP